MAEPDEVSPFEAEMQRRRGSAPAEASSPFEAEMQRRRGTQQRTAGQTLQAVGSDLAWQPVQGVNQGIDTLLNLPYNVARGAAWLAGYELPEPKPIAGAFNPGGAVSRAVADVANPVLPEFMQGGVERPPQTTVGRYLRSAGEAIGASAIPAGATISNAQRLAALAPTTIPRALGRTVGEQIVQQGPRAAAVADVTAATAGGIAQQAAHDAELGPGWEALAGVIGGATPAVVSAAASKAIPAVRAARVNATPAGRAVNSLGDTTVDELGSGVAIGFDRRNAALSERIFRTLGEEMVATNGQRGPAIERTIGRLMTEGNVSRETAIDQIRRVASAQADSELLLGEYPAVLQSNRLTRNARDAGNVADEAAGRVDDSVLQQEIDRIANAGNTASAARVRNAVDQRTGAVREQAERRLQEMAPGSIEDVQNRIQTAQRLARGEYDAAHNGSANYGLLHPLLGRIVERHLNRMAGRSDDQAGALNEAINRLYTSRPAGSAPTPDHIPGLEDQLAIARQTAREMRRQKAPKGMQDEASRNAEGLAEELRLARREGRPAEQQVLMPSLQMLQDARGGIRGQMQAARQAGRNDIVNTLQPLYDDITRAMQRSSPAWRRANQRWGDMHLDEVAQELGDSFAMQAGPRFREQLRNFQRMAPEAQDVVRIHFAQKLIDKIVNAGETHDLAKLFSTPHVRRVVRTVLGDDAAVDLARLIRDNRVITTSRGMLRGSQTHRRGMAQKEDDTDLGLLAAVDTASVSGFRKMLLDWTVGVVRERRNRGLARIITTPVRDTAATAEQIERMRRALAVRNQANEPINPMLGYSGILAPLGGIGSQ